MLIETRESAATKILAIVNLQTVYSVNQETAFLRLTTASILVAANWRVLIRTKPGIQSTESLWSDDRIGFIKPLCQLELVLRHKKFIFS